MTKSKITFYLNFEVFHLVEIIEGYKTYLCIMF